MGVCYIGVDDSRDSCSRNIRGRFGFSDAVAYLMARDVSETFGDDSGELVDHRPPDDPERLEEDRRFMPIEVVFDRLVRLTDRDCAVAWLTSRDRTGDRPLALLAERRFADVHRLIDGLTEDSFDRA